MSHLKISSISQFVNEYLSSHRTATIEEIVKSFRDRDGGVHLNNTRYSDPVITSFAVEQAIFYLYEMEYIRPAAPKLDYWKYGTVL